MWGLSSFRKLWFFDRGPRPTSMPEVVVHDPNLSKPHDLDDTFLRQNDTFLRQIRCRLGSAERLSTPSGKREVACAIQDRGSRKSLSTIWNTVRGECLSYVKTTYHTAPLDC